MILKCLIIIESIMTFKNIENRNTNFYFLTKNNMLLS